jgi:hypothetical protein
LDGKSMRVRLFLDVDGVLNAVNPTGQWPDLKRARVNRFPICWSPTVVEFFNELSTRVEILWLTTWEERAQELLAPVLGLRAFQLAAEDTDPLSIHWWKHTVVQQWWENDPRPFIWVDDELADADSVPEWLGQLPEGQALAISPDFNDGLHQAHLDEIHQFVALHDDRPVSNLTE